MDTQCSKVLLNVIDSSIEVLMNVIDFPVKVIDSGTEVLMNVIDSSTEVLINFLYPCHQNVVICLDLLSDDVVVLNHALI